MSNDTPSYNKSLFDKFLDAICTVCTVVAGVGLVFMTVIFGWLVYGRYVLNATPTWVEQISLLLVVLIGFIGAAIGIHKNTHLGVSFFRDMSPRPVRRAFELISHLIMMGFGAVMMVNSYYLVMFKWDTQIPLIHLPEGLRAVPIMICGALVFLFSIGHLIHFFQGIEEKSEITE